jgi:hypothetical protein
VPETPQICSLEDNPVCGCDGDTYANDCARQNAGVPLDHPGACVEVPVECAENAECSDDEFCSKPSKGDDSCEGMGECEPTPTVCSKVNEPVCGCDDITYGNQCKANASGVSVSHPGACEPVGGALCGGMDEVACEKGEICALEPADKMCDDYPEGICVPDVGECPTVYEPVCGCDDVTYGNTCEAREAGAQVASEGECEDASDVCGGELGLLCDLDEVCAFPDLDKCVVAPVGQCIATPDCSAEPADEVCGCDTEIYKNECLATVAEMQISPDPTLCVKSP